MVIFASTHASVDNRARFCDRTFEAHHHPLAWKARPACMWTVWYTRPRRVYSRSHLFSFSSLYHQSPVNSCPTSYITYLQLILMYWFAYATLETVFFNADMHTSISNLLRTSAYLKKNGLCESCIYTLLGSGLTWAAWSSNLEAPFSSTLTEISCIYSKRKF